MKKITIKDIAAKFDVSISTVSKALNDSYEISDKTKEKIQKYAKKKKYKPNFNALSLKNRRTKTIGVVIPNMLNYFFAQVFQGVEKKANEKGYKIITCISNESFDKEVETMEMLSNGSIDGFLVSMSKETGMKNCVNHFNEMIADGTPIVMFDRVAKDVDCDKVVADDYEAAIKTVKHLKNTGCKNIAFISTISDLIVGKDRYKGYLKGMEIEGLPVNENLILNIQENDYKKYEEIISPLFENGPIDSVIASSEQSAIAAMKIAQLKGYKIPENFSVIGFANGLLSRHSSPKLTTVSQHGEIMGETAAEMLIDRLENAEGQILPTVTKVIKTDLVERNSTKSYLELTKN
ncbi:LacI family DNA-binding transcriptional regulator [Flavicella marina]|uniref:LacI family DNA-binding transcriptional regulator n=1 Tax=Flavicella marina TaxID=1475951 RepID=UPI001263EFB8|nr:LacI family DNA-binding transcriptional regulator [Flavicella marina]